MLNNQLAGGEEDLASVLSPSECTMYSFSIIFSIRTSDFYTLHQNRASTSHHSNSREPVWSGHLAVHNCNAIAIQIRGGKVARDTKTKSPLCSGSLSYPYPHSCILSRERISIELHMQKLLLTKWCRMIQHLRANTTHRATLIFNASSFISIECWLFKFRFETYYLLWY